VLDSITRTLQRTLLVLTPAAILLPQALPAAAAVHGTPRIAQTQVAAAKTSRILVANLGPAQGGSITEYRETDNGNVAPQTTIAGPNTGFGITRGPVGIALDPSGRIGISLGNISGNEVETFAPGAKGNVAPLTAIDCFPRLATIGAAFDQAGNLYVSHGGTSIEVFPPGATGCATPSRVITGISPYGIAIDRNDILYVADQQGAVDLFPPGASQPMARIAGSNTGLVEPVSVALDAALNVYVFDGNTSAISEFAAGAQGNVAPIRTIGGSKTGLSGAIGLAVSRTTGKIFVSSPAATAVFGFAPHASGNVAPAQVIAGAATGLTAPWFLTLKE
jgi:hypothetical protein